MHAGHLMNLYNDINTYFMPLILNTQESEVIRYLNKQGFNNGKLIIYIIV